MRVDINNKSDDFKYWFLCFLVAQNYSLSQFKINLFINLSSNTIIVFKSLRYCIFLQDVFTLLPKLFCAETSHLEIR